MSRENRYFLIFAPRYKLAGSWTCMWRGLGSLSASLWDFWGMFRTSFPDFTSRIFPFQGLEGGGKQRPILLFFSRFSTAIYTLLGVVCPAANTLLPSAWWRRLGMWDGRNESTMISALCISLSSNWCWVVPFFSSANFVFCPSNLALPHRYTRLPHFVWEVGVFISQLEAFLAELASLPCIFLQTSISLRKVYISLPDSPHRFPLLFLQPLPVPRTLTATSFSCRPAELCIWQWQFKLIPCRSCPLIELNIPVGSHHFRGSKVGSMYFANLMGEASELIPLFILKILAKAKMTTILSFSLVSNDVRATSARV